MDYIDILGPVLSFAAHAAYSAGGRTTTAHRHALRERLEALLDAARDHRRRVRSDTFDAAWFAVCAWLDERFPDEETFTRSYFPGSESTDEFFVKLDRLLNAPGLERFDPGRLQAIEVFAACLELGFRGLGGKPADRRVLRQYLDCCRRELAAGGDTVAAALAMPDSRPRNRPAGRLATVCFWLIPVAATLLLYAFYSSILADLCAGVIE